MKTIALLMAAVLLASTAEARRPRRGRKAAPVQAAEAAQAPEPAADAGEAPAPLKPSMAPAAPKRRAAQPPASAPLPAPAASDGAAERGTAEAPGLALRPVSKGLAVDAPALAGPLSEVGLLAGDLLTEVNGRPTRSVSEVKAALASAPRGDRVWAVYLRDGLPKSGETKFAFPAASPERSGDALTPKEEAARQSHLEAAQAAAAKPLASLAYPAVSIGAGEKLWIRFPEGLRRAAAGDVVTAETAAPMAADRKLDFLAVPPGSKVWLSVLSSREDGPATVLRLHAYKLQLAGGRAYPLSAVPTAAAGSGEFVRVTAAGSIVTTPAESDKNLLGPAWSLQLRLLEPLALAEPESYYRAGPGLWVKEVSESAGAKAFEVTLVASGRSAERAGLKPGDRVHSVAGDSAARLSFAQALDRLYGPQGSDVAVRVTRRGESRSETMNLRRGAAWRQGYGLRLRRDGESVIAQDPAPESPAAKSGVKNGMRLVRVGDADAAGLDRTALKALLEGEGDAPVEFVFSADGKEKPHRLSREWYPSPVKLDAKTVPYGEQP